MACDQAVGILPIDMKDLNISDSGVAKQPAKLLNNNGGKPSGPQLPPAFNFLIAS
jgi:hypothetical protein